MDKLFQLDDCIAFITSRSAKIFAEALEREFRPYNVTRAQWIAMYYINTSESITQRELADKMSVKEPTVVRLLQKMESEGFLYRCGTDADKRIKQLKLTEKGMQIYCDLLPIAEKFKNNTIAGISQDDLDTLISVLQTMVDNALRQKS